MSARTLTFRNKIKINEPGVIAIWHDEMLPVLYYFKDTNAIFLTSQNHLGAALAAFLKNWNYSVFQGSPSPAGKILVKDIVMANGSFTGDEVLVVDDSKVSEDPDEAAGTAKKVKIQASALRALPKGSRLKRFLNKSKFSSSTEAKIDLSQKLGEGHDVGGIVIRGKIIEGAIDRGGKEALKQITAEMKNSTNNFIVTVDGSRGPRHKMKAGALIVAQKTQVPLYLLRASFKGIRLTFSWDKHRIPYPFAEVKFHISNAIRIDTDADKNQINQKIIACEHLLENLVNQ
ncbi:MAG: hypothetical protein ACYS0I_00165 [Planctomycetota bacterium]